MDVQSVSALRKPLSELLKEIHIAANELQVMLGIGGEVAGAHPESFERLVTLNNEAKEIHEKLLTVKTALEKL